MTSTETLRKTDRTIRKIATSAAKKAVEEAEEIGFDDLDETEALNVDIEADVFETHAQALIDAGDFPKFTIYKNGEMIATKPHPYSWERLQKEFGQGHYKIQLKSGNKGTIAKVQTRTVGDPTGGHVNIGFDESEGAEAPQVAKQPSFIETYLLKSDMDAKNRIREQEAEDKLRIRQQEIEAKLETKQKEIDARLRELDAKKDSSSTEIFKLMMTMQSETAKNMQAQSAENLKMIMALQSESTKQANENQKLLMTILTTKKDDGSLTPHELAKMLSDAEKHGYERMKYINEQIEKGAAIRAEEIAEGKNESEDSLIKTVVKGFVPLIAKALDSPALQQGAGQRPPTPQEIAYIENQRLQLQNRQIEAENKRREAIAKRKAAQTVAPVATASNPVPLPPQAMNGKESLNGSTGLAVKEQITDLALSVLAVDLPGGVAKPHESAEKCAQVFLEKGITLKQVLENFKLADIMDIHKSHKLPDEWKPWLKDFYASLESLGSGKGVAEVVELRQ